MVISTSAFMLSALLVMYVFSVSKILLKSDAMFSCGVTVMSCVPGFKIKLL